MHQMKMITVEMNIKEMMRKIIKYFTCEWRYSRAYSYHIRLLMHFTRVKLLNLPYYIYRSIDKMASVVKKRSYAH